MINFIAKYIRSEEHTSELQSPCNLVCRLLLEKKNKTSDLPSPCTLVRRVLLVKAAAHSASSIRFQAGSRYRHAIGSVLHFFFFFNDTATTEIYTLSLHDALPISVGPGVLHQPATRLRQPLQTRQ